MKWLVAVLLFIVVTFIAFSWKNYLKEESFNSNCDSSTSQNDFPEFVRGFSLLSQRLRESEHYPEGWTDLYNCIRVEYKDLSTYKAEGVFYLDKKSKANVYTIYVDNSYKASDDVLTASLLSHETMHVRQLKNFQLDGVEMSCIDSEIDAFKQQIIFLFLALNEEEQKSILARIIQDPSSNTAYFSIAKLFEIEENAAVKAAEKYKVDSNEDSLYAKGFWEIANVDVEKMVRENYKEQCGEG